MFGFWSKTGPKALSSNPGKGAIGQVSFSNAQRNWTERYDFVKLLSSVLRKRQHQIQIEKSWLLHKPSGFTLIPQMVVVKPLNKGGAQTTTTIQTNHPVLVPNGIFEYQHSTGDTVEDSARQGFEQWAQTDFVALLDALKPTPDICTTLKMTFPEKGDERPYLRRAILGPVVHYVQEQGVYAESKTPGQGGDVNEGDQCERHEFCPCCLLTNSFGAFKELFEDREFYGVRMFAARDANGTPQADCRVNGEDWQKGAEALTAYARTWPQAGFEFRKQYVVLQNAEKET